MSGDRAVVRAVVRVVVRRAIGGRRARTRAVTLLASLLLAAAPASAQRRFTPDQRCTEAQRAAGCLLVLGSGMPVPDPDRSGPAYALVFGERVLLFDAGAGVMRRAAAAGLPIDGFTGIFLTHLHSDHTLGLADALLTPWVMGRRTPQVLIGPPGTQRMVTYLLAAYQEDIAVRRGGLERLSVAPGARVRETRGGVVYDSAGLTITALRVPHGAWAHAFGYLITTPSRRIVLSGDAAPSAALAAAARGADLLVHETYPEVRLVPENRPGGEAWPAYMRSVHTSDVEVGALAARAGVRQLVLSHIVRMGGTDDELLAGVRRGGFTGPVAIAADLSAW